MKKDLRLDVKIIIFMLNISNLQERPSFFAAILYLFY